MIELVLGGARCGKSQYAEQQALSSGKKLIYIATAQAFDDEMRLRIAQHQQRRQQQWQTSEQALQLAETLSAFDDAENCILVDCLTLYLSNHLLNGTDSWQQEKPQLLTALQQMNADVILVSNEVGQGVIPIGEINRRFVDEAGVLHQDIASIADKVTLVTAGLAQVLKA